MSQWQKLYHLLHSLRQGGRGIEHSAQYEHWCDHQRNVVTKEFVAVGQCRNDHC